jgi:branched-chain amino acid transport system substrate-binding protein
MRGRSKTLMAAALAVVAAAAGCSSSSKSSSTGSAGGSSSGGKTITVGILADLTGAGSNTAGSFPLGIKAGIGLATGEGYNIKYVEADTTTSPAGELAGAQKLVEQDHVFAVFLTSVLGFSAAPFLASHGIPVIGCACDGTEWIADRNMFSVIGTQDYNKVPTTYGLFLKQHGVTNMGAVGYGIEPSSADVAKEAAIASEHYGIKVGYLNTNFPLGSTNVAPIALAMKSAGIDGLATGIITNSTFAIVDALKLQGVNLKAVLLPVGYGGDLTQGGPAAAHFAEGLYFTVGWEPVELHNAATEKFQNALKTYAGVTGEPTFAEYIGYTTVDAFVQGLKAAGSNATQAQFINAMLGIRNYGALGLYGNHSIGFAMDQRGLVQSADNCIWITQFLNGAFHPVPGESPLCGSILPGVTVKSISG